MNESVTSGKEGAHLDAGLAFGKSHRVSLDSSGRVFWSKQNRLLASKQIERKQSVSF
jgi:hypothetical protein